MTQGIRRRSFADCRVFRSTGPLGLALGLIAAAANVAWTQERAPAIFPDNARHNQRLERLQVLADVWGRVFLFHPAAATVRIDWERALSRAIPSTEQARNALDAVDALNRDVLAPLNDPMTYAFLDDEPFDTGAVRPIKSRVLAPGVGYVALTDPRALADPSLFTNLSRQIESLGKVGRLVVDARWIRSRAPEWAADWLRLWVDSTLLMGSRVARQHKGWTEVPPVSCCANLYGQAWIRDGRLPLEPIRRPNRVIANLFRTTDFASLPIVRTPTLVVVNRTSYPHLERELDALQSTGRIVIALEPIGKPLTQVGVSTYADGVCLRIHAAALLSSSGELGSRPDYISRGPIGLDELPALAARLTPALPLKRSAEFTFPSFSSPEGSVDSTLTREQRLYGLFKVWTVIDHLYPHKRGITGDWSTLLADLVPEVETAQGIRDYTRVMLKAAVRLNDNHAGVSFPGVPLQPPWTIPAWLDRIGGRTFVVWPIPGGTEQPNPLRTADEILNIDGRTPDDIIESYRSIVSVSQPSAYLFTIAMAGLLGTRGDQGSAATIQLRRAGLISTVTVRRTQPTPLLFAIQNRQPLARRLDRNLCYINIGRLQGAEVLDSLFREFRDCDGILLDNRFGRGVNDYHAVINNIGDQIVSRWQTPIADMLSGSLRHGYVEEQSRSVTESRNQRYLKPIVVLTAPTQSAGEALPQWVRDSRRGLTVGTTTAGAQGNTSNIALPGGGRFVFSAMRIINPDGTDYQRVGTAPDVPVVPTIAGVRGGRDEVLERGTAVLQNLVSGRAPRR